MRGIVLNHVVAALRELGGYFVFADETGEQYALVRTKDIDQLQLSGQNREVQLSLSTVAKNQVARQDEEDIPSPSTTPRHSELTGSADGVLERINREIALYQLQQEEMTGDIQINELAEQAGFPSNVPDRAPGGKEQDQNSTSLAESPDQEAQTVSFEPLRGDLSPDLQ